jgi:hypothetical protein
LAHDQAYNLLVAATNLFAPPAVYTLPLTKGRDLVIDFKQKMPDGEGVLVYTEYGEGVEVLLIIDTAPEPIVAEAVIDGYHAVVKVESDITDDIPGGTYWRCLVSIPDNGSEATTTDLVPCNGRVSRFDGK